MHLYPICTRCSSTHALHILRLEPPWSVHIVVTTLLRTLATPGPSRSPTRPQPPAPFGHQKKKGPTRQISVRPKWRDTTAPYECQEILTRKNSLPFPLVRFREVPGLVRELCRAALVCKLASEQLAPSSLFRRLGRAFSAWVKEDFMFLAVRAGQNAVR